MWGTDLLSQGLKWRIGNGQSIQVLKDQWIPNANNPYIGRDFQHMFSGFRVKDLFDPSSKQ